MTDELGVLPPARHRGRSQTRVGWCDPSPRDRFAPAPKGALCRDAAGYKWRRHAYIVETRRGLRCCFCGGLFRWDAL